MYLLSTPDIVFYPLTILWSALYGASAGVVFKLMSTYENWKSINHLQILLWKKYPQRSYRKYISNIWASQVKGKSIEIAQYTKEQIERKYPSEPFPFFRIFTNTVFMLCLAPFMAISGLYDGPIYVFKKTLKLRQEYKLVKDKNV